MKKLFAWSALILLMLVCFSAGLGALGKNDIYFFGDSTTAHLAVRGGIPRERVWSGQARTVLFETVNRTRCVWLEAENRNYKIAEAAAKGKPPILVITLGVSGGAGRLGEQRFKSIYRELIVSVREASPETHIFVQSILPLSDSSQRMPCSAQTYGYGSFASSSAYRISIRIRFCSIQTAILRKYTRTTVICI